MSEEHTPHIGRRQFLKIAFTGVVAALLPSACDSPQHPEQSSTLENLTTHVVEGNTVFINAEGLPVTCRTREGNDVVFDISVMRQARERARAAREPEVGATLSILSRESAPALTVGSPEYPITHELKPDTLTDEQLKQRNITIIQGATTQLYLREGAFYEGAPLAEFDGSRSLTIVLVDGARVYAHYMTATKYDPVREVIDKKITQGHLNNIDGHERERLPITPENVTLLRSTTVAHRRENLARMQALYAKLSTDQQQKVLPSIISNKSEIDALTTQVITDDDLVLSEASFEFNPSGWYEENFNGTGQSYIFVAVSDRRPRDIFSVYFNPDGTWAAQSFTDLSPGLFPSALPLPEHTYPAQITSDPRFISPGSVIRHEFFHDRTRKEPSTRDEDLMNTLTNNELQAAHARWKNSEFGVKDPLGDREYCIEFSVPASLGGGFILT